MEEYSIRASQLKKNKKNAIQLYLLFWGAGIAIEISLYYLYVTLRKYYTNINIEEIEAKTIQEGMIVLYYVVFTIIIFISSSLFLKYLNRKYQQEFLNYIIAEAKLEEIYLLKKKSVKGDERISYLKSLFQFNFLHLGATYSDASSKYSLDVTQIHYIRNKHKRNGILLSVHFDQEKPGFLQLTSNDQKKFDTYNGLKILKYGFPFKSKLKHYCLYSTYQEKTYLMDTPLFENTILNLEKFFKKPIDLVFDNEAMFIFIPNCRITLSDSLFNKISSSRFDEKMQYIREFHGIMFSLIKQMDETII